jgi:hypothetical protein
MKKETIIHGRSKQFVKLNFSLIVLLLQNKLKICRQTTHLLLLLKLHNTSTELSLQRLRNPINLIQKYKMKLKKKMNLVSKVKVLTKKVKTSSS